MRNCCEVLAIITGPTVNPDQPDDDPTSNAYFSRPYCVKELRWALEDEVQIQPIVRHEDKTHIGELVASAPDDLKIIGGIDFVDLIRNDIEVRARVPPQPPPPPPPPLCGTALAAATVPRRAREHSNATILIIATKSHR